MTQQQVILIQRTWKVFRGIEPEIVGDLFYSKLFMEMPALKRMFKSPMNVQHKKFVDMISMIVGRLHNLNELSEDIRELAKRHVDYRVKESHYKTVGIALVWTLQHGLGYDWNDEVKEAWEAAYNTIADTMISASGYK